MYFSKIRVRSSRVTDRYIQLRYKIFQGNRKKIIVERDRNFTFSISLMNKTVSSAKQKFNTERKKIKYKRELFV